MPVPLWAVSFYATEFYSWLGFASVLKIQGKSIFLSRLLVEVYDRFT